MNIDICFNQLDHYLNFIRKPIGIFKRIINSQIMCDITITDLHIKRWFVSLKVIEGITFDIFKLTSRTFVNRSTKPRRSCEQGSKLNSNAIRGHCINYLYPRRRLLLVLLHIPLCFNEWTIEYLNINPRYVTSILIFQPCPPTAGTKLRVNTGFTYN